LAVPALLWFAELCGITERTLERWKKEPEFSERVKAIVLAYSERALRGGLARREKRVAVLNDMHDRMLTVIDERAEDVGMQVVPGGKSGLITKQLKGIGKGEDFQVVEVYEVDTALVRELRATQEQIAKELGQWVEKRDVKVNSILFAPQSDSNRSRISFNFRACGISSRFGGALACEVRLARWCCCSSRRWSPSFVIAWMLYLPTCSSTTSISPPLISFSIRA
jgi:hypothetical protein